MVDRHTINTINCGAGVHRSSGPSTIFRRKQVTNIASFLCTQPRQFPNWMAYVPFIPVLFGEITYECGALKFHSKRGECISATCMFSLSTDTRR